MITTTIPDIYEPLLFGLTDPDHPPARYFAFSGGRSSGKSTATALALVLEGCVRPIRVLCTREFQNSIKESVMQLLLQLIDQYGLPGYTSTLDEIRNRNGTRFIFKGLHNSPESTIKGFEAVDRCWVEEAQFITDQSLQVLIPTIRKPHSTLIFTWNPLTRDDPVMRRFVTEIPPLDRPRTYYRHTTWRTLAQAGLLTDEVRQMIAAARDTRDYAHVWEGVPYENVTNGVISWQDLDDARHRPPDRDGGTSFGVDVARYGADRTAVAVKQGRHLAALVSWQHASIPETVRRILTLADQWHPTTINVDDTGVGGGVTDMLREAHAPVTGINYAQAAKDPTRYPNVASELWFDFQQQLGSVTIDPALDHLPDLMQELSTREWHIDSRSRRQIQAKDAYKHANLVGSPDLADAVLLAFYRPAVMPAWDDVV